MAIFTAAATALLAGTFLAGNAIAIGVLATGLALASQVGLSYAIKKVAGNQDNASNDNDNFGVQFKLTGGGDVPRSFPLGQCATAGQLVYANTFGVGGVDVQNVKLVQVIKLSDLPRTKIIGLLVNGERVTVPNGGVLTGPRDGGGTPGWPVAEYIRSPDPDFPTPTVPHLYIDFYDGTQTVAAPYLVDAFGASPDRPYQATRVGTGCAYAIVTAIVNDYVWTGGAPQLLFELASIPLYDPSKDDTAGGAGPQRYSNPATWGGDGDNYPAVQIYNIKRGIFYNGEWVYGLQTSTAARLPAENWIAQTAKCRAAIQGEDGDEPTYRSGMQITVNTQPMNAVKSLLMACQGRVSETAGFFKLYLGAPDSPVFAFSDGDIVSIEEQVFTPFLTLSASCNGMQARYPDPDQGWNYATAPAYYRADLEERDGNRRLMATPQFDAVPYPAQVQRLQRSAIEEAQRERQHTLVLPPSYWIYEPGDVGAWTSVRNGYEAKLFRIDASIDKANLDTAMTLTEVNPDDFDWDHGGDFTPVTGGPLVIPPQPAQGITDFDADPVILRDDDGLPRRPGIRISWNAMVSAVSGVQYEVRLAANETDVTSGIVPLRRLDEGSDEGATVIAESLLPNTDYEVRGRYVPSSPRPMAWSDWIEVTTPDVRISAADVDAAISYRLRELQGAFNDRLAEIEQRFATLTSRLGGQSWSDIRSVRNELSARSENALAQISDVRTVAADSQTAFASYQLTVSTQFQGVFTSISTVNSAVASLNGYAASSTISVNVNGYVIGTKLINGGPGLSAFIVQADKFQVQLPGVNGDLPVDVLTTGTVNGTPAIGIRANLYLDGFVTARMITVTNLAAVSGDMGTLRVGKIESFDTKFLIHATDKQIIIADNT